MVGFTLSIWDLMRFALLILVMNSGLKTEPYFYYTFGTCYFFPVAIAACVQAEVLDSSTVVFTSPC